MLRLFLFSVCLGSLLFTTACTYKEQFEHSDQSMGSRDESDIQYMGLKTYGNQLEGIEHHDIKTMEYNHLLSAAITRLDGIFYANVITTDDNAYVAIMTGNSATGTNGIGRKRNERNRGSHLSNEEVRNKAMQGQPPYLINEMNIQYTIADPKHISSKLKQKIADTIRAEHPQVTEVYISANSDFMNLVHSYKQEAWMGRNLNNYVDEFRNYVKSHFIE